jgi:predicted nucleic acid-binding protein
VASNPERIYWDSCTYIDYLEGSHPLAAEMEMIMEDWRSGLVALVTSALTIAEVLYVKCADEKRRADRSREKDIEALFNPPPGPRFLLVELNRKTALKARDLVWNAGIDPKDAIHVASALEARCEVLYTTEGPLRTKTGLVGGSPNLRIEAPAWTKQLVAQEDIQPGSFTSLIGPSEPEPPAEQSPDAAPD